MVDRSLNEERAEELPAGETAPFTHPDANRATSWSGAETRLDRRGGGLVGGHERDDLLL